ncbi:MAG: oligoendopeptidase F [Clostridia bacterium]|nr:oligoendopeptidase F [Clostridia bacterium]
MTENKIPLRNEADKKYTWHTEDLFASDEVWEKKYKELEEKAPQIEKYKDTMTSDGKALFEALGFYNSLAEELDSLYVYAYMKFHEDSTNSVYQGLSGKADALAVKVMSLSSFICPKIAELSKETVDSFYIQCPELKMYEHFLDGILRQKEHTLSEAEERLLASADDIASASQTIFTMINEADMEFPDITDSEGKKHGLSHGKYVSYLENNDRVLRKSAFDTLYETYLKQKNTIAATYNASVKKDIFYANARKYNSALEMALEDDNIPVSVYDNLIDAVHEALPLMHRYVALRKKLLGVEELHMYDLYAPLVKDVDWKISYEEAKKTVKEALSVMGKDYTDALQKGFDGGWIDVYENKGKRSGAYSWGAFGGHPYVLLNHNDTVNSMFTVAHEMGHALHSYFTWEKQPFVYSGHKIFVAEVASTCNEALLMEYLLKTETDPSRQLYLINYFMEQFRGTLFRQTMFAEFEKKAHEMSASGTPLTCENLSAVYHDLNKLYFGDDILIDDYIDIEWARIPHFYNAFYVYQYATGYSAAIALSRKILNEGQPAVDRYLDFLSKGSSEYSIDLLKGAGVDMTSKKPIEDAMEVFRGLLDKMEKLSL